MSKQDTSYYCSLRRNKELWVIQVRSDDNKYSKKREGNQKRRMIRATERNEYVSLSMRLFVMMTLTGTQFMIAYL
jgi:hypothetical protein